MRALVRPTSPTANLSGLDLETVTGDLNDPAGYAGAIQGARYVFHAAADYRLWAPDAGPMYRTNVEGTRVVLEAAAKAGVERIVYTSSVAALKAVPGRLADETDFYASEEGIIGHYKRSKYQAELQALELARRGFPVVIVNPAAPIGPRDIKPTPTGRIITDFLNGKLPAYIDTGLNAVHVDDVAYGHWLAAAKGRAGERYILSQENLTFKQILDLLSEETGLPSPAIRLPYYVALAAAAVDSTVSYIAGRVPRAPWSAVRMSKVKMFFSNAKARSELGFAPRPVREAFRDAVDWFVEKGYAPAPPKRREVVRA